MSEDSIKLIGEPERFNLRFLGQVQVKGKQKSKGIFECFDGDVPELVAHKQATLSYFEDGMRYYLNKEFSKAFH